MSKLEYILSISTALEKKKEKKKKCLLSEAGYTSHVCTGKAYHRDF